jgi:hypothetical protein
VYEGLFNRASEVSIHAPARERGLKRFRAPLEHHI